MKTWTDCPAETVEQQIVLAQLEILRRHERTGAIMPRFTQFPTARTDGNRALLGRSSPDDSATLVLATRSEARSNIVTGEQAFLGRVEASNRRRIILAW